MTFQEAVERLRDMKVFHEKNENNLEALDVAIRIVEAFAEEVAE